jgi:hypothetical protein
MHKLILAVCTLALALPTSAAALPTPTVTYGFDSSSTDTTFATGDTAFPLNLNAGASVSGGTLVLDGNDDYTEVRDQAFSAYYTTSQYNGAFTIAVRVRSTNWGYSWQPLVFQDNDSRHTYNWAIYGTTNDTGTAHAYVRIRDDTTLETLDLHGSPGKSLSDGAWHHLALVVEGPMARLYFDGQKIDDQTSSLTFGSVDLPSNHLFVGGDTYFSSEKFGGYIDDVTYFNEALDSTDVTELQMT